MSVTLAFLLAGVTLLARWTHAIPYAAGSPTVISQEVRYVLGSSGVAKVLFYVVQAATLLVLYTGGNTSFNGFPYLASFVAGDQFLPRQLTRRGHRLAFSNGILVLAAVAIALLLATQSRVSVTRGAVRDRRVQRLHDGRGRDGEVPPDAPRGVTGDEASRSTASPPSSRRRSCLSSRWRSSPRGRGSSWSSGRSSSSASSGCTAATSPRSSCSSSARRTPSEAPILSRNVVVVFVDHFDLATAPGSAVRPEPRPPTICGRCTSTSTRRWRRSWKRTGAGSGMSRIPLDIVECRDRRLTRAALELVADAVAGGETECTVLLPRRSFRSAWQRLLHDRTADRIAAALSVGPARRARPSCRSTSATWSSGRALSVRSAARRMAGSSPGRAAAGSKGPMPSRSTRPWPGGPPAPSRSGRRPVAPPGAGGGSGPVGRGSSPGGGTSNLECVLVDDTGRILLVFQGRPRIPGIETGARLVAAGMVGSWDRRLALLNPDYELVAGATEPGGT